MEADSQGEMERVRERQTKKDRLTEKTERGADKK